MALTLIWSKRAASGYANILNYLDKNWTVKEVKSFEQEMESFFNTLSTHPYILKESKKKGLRRGSINKLTLLTYRVNEKENTIHLINIRGTRQELLNG